MSILICAGYYSNSLNANTKIALNIAKEISKSEDCHLVFLDTEITENINFVLQGIGAIRIVENKRMSELKRSYHEFLEKGGSLFEYCIRKPLKAICYSLYIAKAKTLGLRKSNYINCLSKIVEDKKIDKVITFSYPFKPSSEVVNNIYNVKKVFYQLDPTGYKENTNRLLSYIRKNQEIKAFENSDYIFTTSILYKKYTSDKKYSDVISKIFPIEFPNLVVNKRNYENNDTNDIYYLGLLEDEYRSPEKFLDFFIQANIDSKVVFIGNNYSEVCGRYADKYPDKVCIKKPITVDEALKILNENHFLLNINNALKNQSPSKLIDYISTGNPIVNVVKNDDDVSLNILKNYDNVFNFYEYKTNNVSDFKEFIESNRNRKISENDILDEYKEYTPEYVANKVLKIIK